MFAANQLVDLPPLLCGYFPSRSPSLKDLRSGTVSWLAFLKDAITSHLTFPLCDLLASLSAKVTGALSSAAPEFLSLGNCVKIINA